MFEHSSTRVELVERRDRLLYNAACFQFLLSESKSELEHGELLDDDRLASHSTPKEEMMSFFVQLDQFVRDRVSADPSLGYLDRVDPQQNVQEIKKLEYQTAWLERLLNFLHLEIKMLNDALHQLEQADQ
ncbi:hypothetical protein KBY66_00325 [Synechococcus sp. Tobar12-5m-g]|uniref:hypothetical protein n=1 Tax=unclassified Synechococcus TaxID=2626047 RepID=UPI0020CC148A|nr:MULTISPECIES: hypothetical protein [unclassified Synechococcus]MCP9771080.1 hypothetical protein [Synechococcus sp. Tobar12-5m-g]MCP9872020.1 hypothetical protein [Synechococcus sp. Cruz CV-v-12]